MTRIALRFSPEMARAAIEGRKCCTSRREAKGKPGDEFEIAGNRFRILSVLGIPARTISGSLYMAEGFESTESCAATLQTIYPYVGGLDYLFVHFFARLPTPTQVALPVAEARRQEWCDGDEFVSVEWREEDGA